MIELSLCKSIGNTHNSDHTGHADNNDSKNAEMVDEPKVCNNHISVFYPHSEHAFNL